MKESWRETLLGALPTLLAGASAGLVLGWILSRRSLRSPTGTARADLGGGGARDQVAALRARWSEALDGAVETLLAARERMLREAPPVDLGELGSGLAEVDGGEGVHLRDLGGGIIEALGSATDEAAVGRVLSYLRSAPGVAVVVNRIWTPGSAGRTSTPFGLSDPRGVSSEIDGAGSRG